MQFGGFTPQLITAAAATANVTLNTDAAVITTNSLTTAAGAQYTFTINCPLLKATTVALASVGYNGSTGTPVVLSVLPAVSGGTQMGPGTVTILLQNIHASAALNGTLTISLALLNG